jgi:hypothetical protein
MKLDPLWLAREIWRDATPLCRWTIAVPFIGVSYLATALLMLALPVGWLVIKILTTLERHAPKFWRT